MRRSLWIKPALCLLAFMLLFAATPVAAPAQVSLGISVSFGPPAIPYYVQPEDPYPNYIWQPGYWNYDINDGDYYWVPGTWVPAPETGYLWTPGYWAWNGDTYDWNPGYWATSVGYYGGINYGYGYYGRGYAGGRWSGRNFVYNTAVSRVNREHIRNTYSNRSVVASSWNRTSYNGGRGGVNARPTAAEAAVAHGHRIGATSVQRQHDRVAMQNRANFSRENNGRPHVAAVAHPYTTARTAPRGTQARTAQSVHRAPAARGAQVHTASRPGGHAAPAAHTAYHAAPAAHTEHRAAPAAHAAYHAAPAAHTAYHAAPAAHTAYRAPETHAAPAYHAAPAAHAAPAYHAAPAVHAAPAYHPAPAYHAAPAYHPAAAPAYHAAPAMHAAPAARPAAPAAARPDDHDHH